MTNEEITGMYQTVSGGHADDCECSQCENICDYGVNTPLSEQSYNSEQRFFNPK